MILTGVFLSLTISCKMVGLFAFLTVGSAVLLDLWNLLDYRKGLTIVRQSRSLLLCQFVLTLVADAGSSRTPLLRQNFRIDCGTGDSVPFLVLGPLQSADSLRHWRRVHESGLSTDSPRESAHDER